MGDEERREYESLDGHIHSVMRSVVEQREQLLSRLLLMPTGYRLCVHEPTWPDGPTDFTRDVVAVRMSQECHFLPPGSSCEAEVLREEYAVPVLPEATDG